MWNKEARMPTIVRHDGEGEAIWMLNSLVTIKATADETGGAYSFCEQEVTPDGNPPTHVHRDADEAFYVLDGEVELEVDGETVVARRGTFAFAPRGVPHTYRVRSATARLLVVGSPGGLDRFFAAVGEPAGERTLPAPAAPDVERVVAVAAAHAIDVLLPA